jgi:hypothetical protein
MTFKRLPLLNLSVKCRDPPPLDVPEWAAYSVYLDMHDIPAAEKELMRDIVITWVNQIALHCKDSLFHGEELYMSQRLVTCVLDVKATFLLR